MARFSAMWQKRRSTVEITDNQLEGYLRQNQMRYIEWTQGLTMALALIFMSACWVVVVPITGEVQFGWPLHMVCIGLWSTSGDMDYDFFFARRPVLHILTGLGTTAAVGLLIIFSDSTLPCVWPPKQRTLLSSLAWLPSVIHSIGGTMRAVESAILHKNPPKLTSFAIPTIVSIIYAWMINSITVLYFCHPNQGAFAAKIASFGLATLSASMIAAEDADKAVNPTRTFFKVLHLWTFFMGVGFVIEGIAPSYVIYEHTWPPYLITLGVVTMAVVCLMRRFPDKVYGVITSLERRRGRRRAAVAMREFYQGIFWTKTLDSNAPDSDDTYLLSALQKFRTVKVARDRFLSPAKLDARHGDFFVVCSAITNGSICQRAVMSAMTVHSNNFEKAHRRKPTYWILDACTTTIEDLELIPGFAARCERVFLILSSELVAEPTGLILLFSAFLVHCEIERVHVVVTGDFASIFSSAVDRLVESITAEYVRNMLLSGGFPENDEDDSWWREWETRTKMDSLTPSNMLVRITGSKRCPRQFSADLRDRFAAVIHYNRQEQWEMQSRDKSTGPTDFTAVVAMLTDSGMIEPKDIGDLPRELPRTSIELQHSIGKGQFGEVRRGVLHDDDPIASKFEVAVKILIDSDGESSRQDFLREAAITWALRHDNVVRMYGVVTAGYPNLLVLEYCSNGELKSYLAKKDTDRTPDRLSRLMLGIALGMAHLAASKFVHRDLAARNVLVDENLEPKIADFGLGREVREGDEYQASNKNMLLPIRWTDPEVLCDRKFSEFTDVWAYGVTSIEIWSQGETPYRGWTIAHVIELVGNGYRLPQPANCPDEVYEKAILPCFHPVDNENRTKLRPTFSELVVIMETLVADLAKADLGTTQQQSETEYIASDDLPEEHELYTVTCERQTSARSVQVENTSPNVVTSVADEVITEIESEQRIQPIASNSLSRAPSGDRTRNDVEEPNYSFHGTTTGPQTEYIASNNLPANPELYNVTHSGREMSASSVQMERANPDVVSSVAEEIVIDIESEQRIRTIASNSLSRASNGDTTRVDVEEESNYSFHGTQNLPVILHGPDQF